jgi:hypothetical protein
MGRSPGCVSATIEVVNKFKRDNPDIKTVKVLSMGYPDILLDVKDIPLEGLEVHPESAAIAGYHGRKLNIPTSESFFKALGAEFTCVDIKKWRGNELILDLNTPVGEELFGQYHIILDMGTTEHCFNVGTVMQNYTKLCAVGGFIIHWNPMYMANHGFYNFSPTFFHDWYLANGSSVEHQSAWELEHPTKPEKVLSVPKTERFGYKAENISLLTIAKKIEDVETLAWPTQTKYAKMEKMGA